MSPPWLYLVHNLLTKKQKLVENPILNRSRVNMDSTINHLIIAEPDFKNPKIQSKIGIKPNLLRAMDSNLLDCMISTKNKTHIVSALNSIHN